MALTALAAERICNLATLNPSPDVEDQVILVDGQDNPIGTAGKMAAHRTGSMHRAISVFVLDAFGRLLLQKRAWHKYHSGGLWSNTCCSHPRPGEVTAAAARRRLREEMGIDCELTETFSFTYRTDFSNGLIEHEYDHVFFGRYASQPLRNPDEVDDWKWVELPWLAVDVKLRPAAYSSWLSVCLDSVLTHSSSFRAG